MSKLIGNNSSKKLRVLKYSLLASISVGSIVAVPMEGMAIGNKSASIESLNRADHYNNINADSYAELIKQREQSEINQLTAKELKNKQKNAEIQAIKESIVRQMQQISSNNYKTLETQLQDIETKIANIQDKEKKESAKKELSLIKEQVKAGELAQNEAKKIAEKAKEATSRTKLKKQQKQIANYIAIATKHNIEAGIKNLEISVPTPPTPPSTSTIPTHLESKDKNGDVKIPLTPYVSNLNNKMNKTGENDGYEIPISGTTPAYMQVILGSADETLVQPKQQNFDSGFESLKNNFESLDNKNYTETVKTTELPLGNIYNELNKRLDYLDLVSSTFDLDKLDTIEQIGKVRNAKEFIEEQYSKNPSDALALETLNLSVRESQLEQEANKSKETFEQKPLILQKPVLNTQHQAETNRLERELKALITDPNKNPEENLAYLDLENVRTAKNSKKEQYCALHSKNPNDSSLKELAIQALNLNVEQSRLEQKIQDLKNEAVQNNSIPQIIVTSPNDEPIYATINKDKKRANSKVILETDKEKFDTGLPETSTLEQQLTHADSEEDIDALFNALVGNNENLDEEFEELVEFEGLNNKSDLITSDISGNAKVENIPAPSDGGVVVRNEEPEDKEVTEFPVQKASKSICGLPAPSNGYYGLELSDGSGYEDSELEEERDNDSGIGGELSDLEVSDSEEEQVKAINKAINTAIHKEKVQEAVKNIAETPVTTNHSNKVVVMVKNAILNTRLDTTTVIKNNEAAMAAGDNESSIQRGLWVRGMYGTNNQGRINNVNGYKGINKGGTIGFDVEIDNNVIGIAYSNVHSVFKFKNNKNNDKELINSHVISVYGQKELPKNFTVQALIAASRNFIKDKTTYSLGDIKFKSSVKHRNDSYNAEALLNYNHLTKNNVIITPNIGLRYGKSRDGVYNETGISVQEISLTMKENNIMAGIVGTKVRIPLKDILKVNNLGLTLHGAVEHNIKEKTQRVNRIVQILDNKFTQNYVIPKQPKTSYNLGTGIIGNIKNTTISLEYNHYLNKHYRSHQGSVKLKVSL
ncbi:MAG TPA: autotransporter outer membrane beta-barrel domain-containing protein [Rickettsia endosymbiont of Pyrocoelia pectoralis]|nr:autotransporter outer membrane beta-barrel domain-containing protein [Rickettsia endosymbiont of Pyrocoelia pectoralis]